MGRERGVEPRCRGRVGGLLEVTGSRVSLRQRMRSLVGRRGQHRGAGS